MILRLAIGFLILLGPGLVSAAPYCDPWGGGPNGARNIDCYKKWCVSQNGNPVFRYGNWGCDVPRTTSSYGGYSGGSSGAELGRQIGGVLGAMIREGLFGNPQQEAQRQQALAAQRQWEEQERQRLAAERARQEEERYQRLRGSLLDFNPGPQLSLMGQPSGDGLQLMLGEDAERGANPALAELARAAAWSTLAARAPTPEDAAMLADAAFQSLVGGKVNLPPPPPEVKGVPVGPLLPQVEPLKKQYVDMRAQLPGASDLVRDAEQRLAEFARLEEEARALERSAKDAARKKQAREAIRQAQQLKEEAEANRQAMRAEFQRHQRAINDIEQALRALLSSMAAAPRQPDSHFYLGFEDGSQCFSQNAGPRCDKARAPAGELQTCIASYRLGYTAGEKLKNGLLEDAFNSGGRDKQKGAYAITDPRANGPCRYEYIMAYNRGYFSTRVGPIASAQTTSRTDVPATGPAARGTASEVQRIIDGMTASSRRLGWSAEEQERLKQALNNLDLTTADDYRPDLIRQSWTDVLARPSGGDYARDAARGQGPGLYGAGTQAGGQDCAIFAVATAAGKPYGVVAARATRLISEGEWRDAGDRANPQGVIGRSGLNGGEVIMLAEAFGRAEVVKPSEFAQALKAGRPVMVNVVPRSGDTRAGHQLVLAKTFQRGGETWYEVIDSNAGPTRRLYMSAGELNLLIRENGVAYRPEPGTTPALLRAGEERR
jgi:hypothetical protein